MRFPDKLLGIEFIFFFKVRFIDSFFWRFYCFVNTRAIVLPTAYALRGLGSFPLRFLKLTKSSFLANFRTLQNDR